MVACGATDGSGSFSRRYEEPEIRIKAQPRTIPAENRYCWGKEVVSILSGSENNGLEARGPNDEDSIVEQFNKQSRGVCIDLVYGGSTDIAFAIRDGRGSVGGEVVDLYLPAASWAFEFGGRANISQFQSLSQTNVVFALKPGIIELLRNEFQKEFDQDLASVNNLSVDQVNWIVGQRESITAATSPTHSNSGFSYAVAAITEGAGGSVSAKSFDQPATTAKLKAFFENVEFVSSSTGFVMDLLLKHPEVNSILTYEMLAIQHNLNVETPEHRVRIFYLDLPLADMPLGLRSGASAAASRVYEAFPKFLQNREVQELMVSQGRRLSFSSVQLKTYPSAWGVLAQPNIKRPEPLQQVLIQAMLEQYAASVRPKSYLIWALDYSSSMEGSGEETLERIVTEVHTGVGKKYFVAPVAGDTVVLVPFEGRVRGENALIVRGGSEELAAAVQSFAESNSAGGSTDGFAAVRWATQKFNQDASGETNLGRPTILLISDGEFAGSFDGFMKWAEVEARRAGRAFVIPQVIQISVGTQPNSELNRLAEATGGRTIIVSSGSAEELGKVLRYARGYSSHGLVIGGSSNYVR